MVRRCALLAAVVLASLPFLAEAQSCLPPAPPLIQWHDEIALFVQFTGRSTAGTFQACDTFHWEFDDGSPASTEQNPLHEFQGVGIFLVEFTVINSAGSATATTQIAILGTDTPYFDFERAFPAVVRRGSMVTLIWRVHNATEVRIDPLGVTLPAAASYEFRPSATAKYWLIAFGEGGQAVSDAITVTVLPLARRRLVRH